MAQTGHELVGELSLKHRHFGVQIVVLHLRHGDHLSGLKISAVGVKKPFLPRHPSSDGDVHASPKPWEFVR